MNSKNDASRIGIGEPDDWIEAHRAHDTQIKTFQVLGERSSGTNYVDRLLDNNLKLRPVNHFQWKHGYPLTHFIPRSSLIVVSVRDPLDWLASMHQKPWHTPKAFWDMPYSNFIRTRWETEVDDWIIRDDLRELQRLERPHRYMMARFWNHFIRTRFPIHRGWVGVSEDVRHAAFGLSLQHDRDPVDGTAFANILQLRNAKMRGYLGLRHRECNFVLARFEVVRKHPEAFLKALCSEFGLTRNRAFVPVDRWLGTLPEDQQSQSAPKLDRPEPDDAAFIWSELDNSQEQALGYAPDEI